MFRDTEHAIFGGVCAGLAKRCEAPRLLVRLLFCCPVLFFGVGLLLAFFVYVVLWVAIRPEPTDAAPLRVDNGAPPSAPLGALLALLIGAGTASAQCPACGTHHAPFERDNPAQMKAEAAAARLIRGHRVPGFPLVVGGCAFEGCGQTQESPRRAIEIACYWGEKRPVMIGYARGRDGFWYSVIGYSADPFPRPVRSIRPLGPAEYSSGKSQ